MNKGFTIVELIAVIAILGILAIIMAPTFGTVSNNVKKKAYDSRKSEIKSQVLSFVEEYIKDKVYTAYVSPPDTQNKVICFTPAFLIQNGIVTSDNDKEEYIKNAYAGKNYYGSGENDVYIKITYDIDKKKLNAVTVDEVPGEEIKKADCDLTDNLIFN